MAHSTIKGATIPDPGDDIPGAGDKVDLRAKSFLSPAAPAPIGGYELSIQYVTA